MADPHTNFGYSTVATAPSPASSGTSLVVQAGDGAKFPSSGSFNATVWPASTQPTTANAEIVRVTAISTDTFTITRAQESTSARTIVIGDQIADTITAKTLTDAELNVYVTDQNKTIPATTQVIFDDYLEVAASFFYELSTDAILVIGDFATPLPAPDQNANIFVTVNNELVPSNSEIVFSDFYELSAPFATEIASNAEIQVGTATPVPVYAPGYEFDYVQITANVTVSASSPSFTTVITGNSVFFDGNTRVKIEFFAPVIETTAALSAFVSVNLFDGATNLCEIVGSNNPSGSAVLDLPATGILFITPSAGVHQYIIQAQKQVAAGTGLVAAGTGTGAGFAPAYYRITKA